jgi:hypothetical protein
MLLLLLLLFGPFFRYLFGPSGVFNLTSPQDGVPIFLSKPHFLDADPSYLELRGIRLFVGRTLFFIEFTCNL